MLSGEISYCFLFLQVAEADIYFLSEMFEGTDKRQIRHYQIILGLPLEKVVSLLLASGNGNLLRVQASPISMILLLDK